MRKAGLICWCGSHDVYYDKDIDGLFSCHGCGSYGCRGAFRSEDEPEEELEEDDE